MQQMQTKVDVNLQTDKSFLYFLSELSKMTEDEVVCTLYDMAQNPLKKVLNEDYNNHWCYQKIRFPNTKLDLKVKVKFDCPVNNKKAGRIYITFDLPNSKKVIFTEEDISTLAIEKILLKKSDGEPK